MSLAIDSAHRLAAHPLRLRLLELYARGEASPSDLAVETGEPIGNVSYHTRILARRGAIHLEKTRQVRGAVEHYYRASVEGRELLARFNLKVPTITPVQAEALLLALDRGQKVVRRDPIVGAHLDAAAGALKFIAASADNGSENHDAEEATSQ